jgi:hypothetical protein
MCAIERDLHVFLDVVQSGSMAQATAQLRVKQASVSGSKPAGIRPTIYADALTECGVAVRAPSRRSMEFCNTIPSMAGILL